MSRFRRVKQEVREILADPDWKARLPELEQWDPGKLVAPLFSLRLDRDENVRWRTVVAFGLTGRRLADAGMEKARVLMRTFMWHMNEESGNLGWGIPEAMAEVMVHQETLAREFSSILASYIYCDEACDGNYLDHPDLRRGVFWGLGRLAQVRPELVSHAERFLVAALDDGDACNRGLSAWVLGILGAGTAVSRLKRMVDDTAVFTVFRNDRLEESTVGDMAREALQAMGNAEK
ncbi:DVU0298 family protein [Salidesulfovibrio onnuriiensis]|uniref:DVU0298 family protein n=1 Tax=Salidesulfovibrio onnuriiensis TaxID=2583823 RepID=UPI0011CCDD33|nr:DVU0298 family protein [Salidesulfovibrio onnuriiensis]